MNPFNSGAPLDIECTLYQCKHCGSWINEKGYIDLEKNPKVKTSKGVYCKYCKTKAMRDQIDKDNKKLLEKNGN